ncbi:type III-A CRISPR-associated RAMP protein Csm3 [uncultured Methanobrevibacter sp.]|uniref:type III-A CRISPR-associated RAMP protein Csm3 n=1 Tax=uncultured Methanobrevibacter sp. TaxID=253161 RepID=UPI0026DF53AB|nr:type III-A CRISPR-associated RAMP protein Csm3 [uncultured Methanobrevibacter sp.]
MFLENYIIKGNIVCETGLHIGGSGDNIDIGGSDNPVIRDSITNFPYIPGSSIKGKLRTLLELSDKKSAESVIRNDGKASNDETCIAAQLFGVSAEEDNTELKYSTRTIVRDAYPTEETYKLWESNNDLLNGTELKYENTINRINSSANPRNMERVPRGSKFNFEIIFSIYEEDNSENILKLLEAMTLIEDNYLGGSGSRGFGQIRFDNLKVSKRNVDYYTDNAEEEIISEDCDVRETIKNIKNYEG